MFFSQGKLIIKLSSKVVIRLQVQFSDYPIKKIQSDNFGEFSSFLLELMLNILLLMHILKMV